MTINFNNNNSGKYSNSKAYIAILGRHVENGPYNHIKADGSFVEISTSDNTNKLTFLGGSTATDNFANYFFTLQDLQINPKTGKFDSTVIPNISITKHLESARLYVALDNWLPIKVIDSLNYSPPSPTNPSLPGYDTIYDKLEFTFQPEAGVSANKVFMNTTSVDFFGVPLTLSIDGVSRGYTQKRASLIDKFTSSNSYYTTNTPTGIQKAILSNFSALVISNPNDATLPLRVISPEHAMNTVMTTNQAAYFNGYFDKYIDLIWFKYDKNNADGTPKINPETLTLSISGNKYTGEVSNGVFNFYNGTTISSASILAQNKPTTAEVLNCNNSLAAGNEVQKNIQKLIAAAINRSVIGNEATGSGDSWCSANAKYYQNSPVHYYAKILHDNSTDKMCYAFGYDDVCNQSSTLKATNKDVAVTIALDSW